MKKIISTIIFVFLFSQILNATEYPLSNELIIKEFGQNYLSLRSQLPYDDSGYFNLDEALVERDKYINILYRLLNDKSIVNRDTSLFESVDINSSDFIFNECIFIFNAITDLIIANGGYQYLPQALGDEFQKMGEKDKKFINSIMDNQYKFYSILYQKENKMSVECADIYAKSVFKINRFSKKLNREALKSLKEVIDKGCVHIGVLSNYSDALIKEGKFDFSRKDAKKQMAEICSLYDTYFDDLNIQELDQPTTLTFLQQISAIKGSEGDHEGVLDINRKISELILSNKIKLENKHQWIRRGYLKLLSKTVVLIKSGKFKNADEIITNLKKVFNRKGNIFISKDDISDLSEEERQLIESVRQVP